MGQGDTTVWTKWIREETDEIMKQLEEERDSRSNPDDPFNGTANGVFLPLQDPLSLPPPGQTPNNKKTTARIQNILKIWREMSGERTPVRRNERTDEVVTPMQGEPRKFQEHSQESLDPMASIQNLHIQQRQSRHSAQELNQTMPWAPQTLRIQVNQ